MLVHRAFETNGIVVDCDIVTSASNKYRKTQDHIAEFVSESVLQTNNPRDRIGKRGIVEHFKAWFTQEQGNRRQPKGQELIEYMNKKFGICKSTGWHGCKFIIPDCDEMDNLDD